MTLVRGDHGWLSLALSGAPYDRGKTHGRVLADEISTALERADFMARQDTGEGLDYFAGKIDSVFEFPSWGHGILEELHGIADGVREATGADVGFRRSSR